MAYTGAAASLVHEGRLRVPTGEWSRADSTSSLSLWPPGYPAAIAVPVAFGVSPIQSGRWINVIAAGVTAATIVAIVATPLGAIAGVVAVVVVFVTQAVVDAHLSVLSEPLFLALFCLLLAAMVYGRDRLLTLGIVSALIVMVRYAGASAPAAAVTWTLLDARYDFRRRLRRASVVALVPAVAMIAWFVRTALRPDRHETPHVAVYGNWSDTLQQARDTITAWLVPLATPSAWQLYGAAALAIVLFVFIVMAAREAAGNRTRRRDVAQLSSLFGAATVLGAWYLIVVIASRAFVGGTIPFDWRILLPAIVIGDVLIVAAVAYWWRAYHRPMRVAIAVGALAWIAASATVATNDAVYAVTEGSDFAASMWRESPLIAWVRAHGNGHPLYSNWPAALYFHSGRIARELPDAKDPGDVSGFGEQLHADHGYVVAFDTPSPDYVTPAALANQLGLRALVRTSDGAVWATQDSVVPAVTPPDSVTAPATPPRQP